MSSFDWLIGTMRRELRNQALRQLLIVTANFGIRQNPPKKPFGCLDKIGSRLAGPSRFDDGKFMIVQIEHRIRLVAACGILLRPPAHLQFIERARVDGTLLTQQLYVALLAAKYAKAGQFTAHSCGARHSHDASATASQ